MDPWTLGEWELAVLRALPTGRPAQVTNTTTTSSRTRPGAGHIKQGQDRDKSLQSVLERSQS
eukprot:6349909-Pyramimonas_sp.AAC.1